MTSQGVVAMERNDDLSTWKARRELLKLFQRELLKEFPQEDYNIFIFGSYITNKFVSGESDIDIIVYCEDQEKQNNIAVFTKEFFGNHNLQSDVLQYFFSMNAPIYALILESIRLTDYFPKKLKAELYYLLKAYNLDMQQKAEKQRYLHWCYLIRKEKLEKEEEAYGGYSE